MKKLIAIFAVAWLAVSAQAAGGPAGESARLEKELQSLPWEQFKAVISAVPKMRAEVEAYGPMGWDFVKTHYRTHAWKRNIDKLDPAQRQQLNDLIRQARAPAAS